MGGGGREEALEGWRARARVRARISFLVCVLIGCTISYILDWVLLVLKYDIRYIALRYLIYPQVDSQTAWEDL